jgi:hypothetical protein
LCLANPDTENVSDDTSIDLPRDDQGLMLFNTQAIDKDQGEFSIACDLVIFPADQGLMQFNTQATIRDQGETSGDQPQIDQGLMLFNTQAIDKDQGEFSIACDLVIFPADQGLMQFNTQATNRDQGETSSDHPQIDQGLMLFNTQAIDKDQGEFSIACDLVIFPADQGLMQFNTQATNRDQGETSSDHPQADEVGISFLSDHLTFSVYQTQFNTQATLIWH